MDAEKQDHLNRFEHILHAHLNPTYFAIHFTNSPTKWITINALMASLHNQTAEYGFFLAENDWIEIDELHYINDWVEQCFIISSRYLETYIHLGDYILEDKEAIHEMVKYPLCNTPYYEAGRLVEHLRSLIKTTVALYEDTTSLSVEDACVISDTVSKVMQSSANILSWATGNLIVNDEGKVVHDSRRHGWQGFLYEMQMFEQKLNQLKRSKTESEILNSVGDIIGEMEKFMESIPKERAKTPNNEKK